MIPQLIELKKDMFNMLESTIVQENDQPVKISQDLEYMLPAALKKNVVVIQNQQIQVNITLNVLGLIKKVDQIIDGCNQRSTAQEIFYSFFNELLENGVTLNEAVDLLKAEYLDIAEKKEGSCAAVARKMGVNRSTLVEFKKRMSNNV